MTLSIAFRVDASIDIGTGHVMRCLTLANALRSRGARTHFICRPHPGHLIDLIRENGHVVDAMDAPKAIGASLEFDPSLPGHSRWLGADWHEDAAQTIALLGSEIVDWLLVDHYALDHRWEHALQAHYRHLMVIDDLADRVHDCDMLLDQNLGRIVEDYCGLLKPHVTTLIGSQYALLRPEFAQLRAESLARRANPELKRLLINMGGVDKANATAHVVEALKGCTLPPDLRITVVMGPHAPWLQHIKILADQMSRPTQVLVNVSNMGEIMAESDLAIGAAGSSSWERCCLGLPSLILVLAENQKEGARALQEAGAAVVSQNVSELAILAQEMIISKKNTELKQMSLAAAAITDGKGVSRIIEQMVHQNV